MEPYYGLAEKLLGLVTSLVNVRKNLREASRDRRDRLADYLLSVADCLGHIASSEDDYASMDSYCTELEVHAGNIYHLLEDELGQDRAAVCARLVAESCHARAAMFAVKDPKSRTQILQTKGGLAAFALALRAS